MKRGTRELIWLLVVICLPLAAQQTIPDAPKPKNPQPSTQFPEDAPQAPKNVRPPESGASTPTPTPSPQGGEAVVTDLSKFGAISISVNFVQIPVIVKDSAGHLVTGLGPQDFAVYEDGVPQRLRYFTSDPFPITAAIVILTELPASTMKKVNGSLPALIGAFSEFDEVALYGYGRTVSQVSGYSGAASVTTATLGRIKGTGREGGPPAVFGPLAQGPSINGHDVNDPNVPGTGPAGIPPPIKESYVLNDAILRAAQDLSKRDRSRRKIIFVVSDGREVGSTASFEEVRKVLLSNNIAVFALGVDTAAIPMYDKLGRIRVPGFGTGNILPRYVDATAGEMAAEFDRQSIEQAYSKIISLARNQYLLGYNARATASSAYRTIEVRVHRPNLTVINKQGYYPLPASSRP